MIGSPTFERLRGIRQAGPSALAFPFKTVTRHEHSLGVYLLLGRLRAARKARVAGLLAIAVVGIAASSGAAKLTEHGFHVAMLVTGGLMCAGGVIGAGGIRNPKPT